MKIPKIIKEVNNVIVSNDYPSYQLLSIDSLLFDEDYQRQPTTAIVDAIAKYPDRGTFGYIYVNRRKWDNNKLYVIDGRTRITAWKQANIDATIPCGVLEIDSQVLESIWFTKLNRHKKNLTSLQTFWPLIVQKNRTMNGILNIMQKAGFVIPKNAPYDQGEKLNDLVTCIPTLAELYDYDKKVLKKTMQLLKHHWALMTHNTTATTIWGLFQFIRIFDKTDFIIWDRVDDIMRINSPIIIRNILRKEFGSSLPPSDVRRANEWVKVFVKIYNHGLNKDKKITSEQMSYLHYSKEDLAIIQSLQG